MKINNTKNDDDDDDDDDDTNVPTTAVTLMKIYTLIILLWDWKFNDLLFIDKIHLMGICCLFQIDRLWKDRLDHPIVNAEITKFMDKKWMVKEQTEINQSWLDVSV